MDDYQKELVKEIITEIKQLNIPETDPHIARILILANILVKQNAKA